MHDLYARWVKRAADVAISFSLLVLLLPVLLCLAVVVWAVDGWPVFFRQTRPGRGEVPFRMVKFRTMREATDGQGKPLADQHRVTPLGAFLRRASLDELPELVNVFFGDMSLVGPRPLLMRYLPYFRPAERRRFEVRPGITGLAQVNGRNLASWDARLALDVKYVEQLSAGLDARILLGTVGAVFGARGVVVAADTVMQDLDAERRDEFATAPRTASRST